MILSQIKFASEYPEQPPLSQKVEIHNLLGNRPLLLLPLPFKPGETSFIKCFQLPIPKSKNLLKGTLVKALIETQK